MRLIDADALWMDIIHSMDYCDDFLSFIDAAPTVPQWIPVTERLPEEDSEYLCTYGALSGWFIGIEYYDTKLQQFGFYTDDGHGRDVWHHVRNVVAWMPLPEPLMERSRE